MKNTKKIISLVLAICMLASLAISASAANTVAASTAARITIENAALLSLRFIFVHIPPPFSHGFVPSCTYSA